MMLLAGAMDLAPLIERDSEAINAHFQLSFKGMGKTKSGDTGEQTALFSRYGFHVLGHRRKSQPAS
jgi:hypothetical protein